MIIAIFYDILNTVLRILGFQNTIIVTASKIILDFIYTQCIYISAFVNLTCVKLSIIINIL